ncbi:proteasome-activating nucleotidase [Methanogenium organophilum]|uniref:Proteasome-activating nucleotidase n=1 Tax=Methanogenium organophilum TaxID=2199 RepID=A0A9X9S342_METOG|nr:proteasome-activating nucleotidase [Methanogenium organophilum]WAI01019.1 proteasome-activating nucleotidase [Methanogenium organophilum]
MGENSAHNPEIEDEDLKQYLLNRIAALESKNMQYKEQVRQLDIEKKNIENQKIRYEREIRKLKSEVEKLRSPPLVIGTVSDIIDEQRVIVQSSAGPRFMVRVSNFVRPEDIKPGLRCTMNQQSLTVVEVLQEAFDSQIYGMEVVDSPEETYDDIGGLEEQIREIKEAVELPLIRPELFRSVGILPPKGVLLYGPPGTGKTLLARAVAHETQAHFLRVVGSELVQKYIGEGSRLVRELFEMAKKNVPSIIFIDEIDAIGAMRSESTTSGDREVQRTLMQLLADMDGFENRGDVKIVAATNRIDILDQALLRPGRFDRIIEIPLPNVEGRRSILEIHSANMALDAGVDLHEVAELTDSKNGSELRAICTEAGMFAIRAERTKVYQSDFIKAIDKVTLDLAHHPKCSPYDSAMFA